MERHTRQSADIPKWSAVLVEAVKKPGLIMKHIRTFIRTASTINCSRLFNATCEACRRFHIEITVNECRTEWSATGSLNRLGNPGKRRTPST